MICVLLHCLVHWNGVALVEDEGGLEDRLIQPVLRLKSQIKTLHTKSPVSLQPRTHLGIGIEQPLVKVISDPASVLDLTYHVLHCTPRDTLHLFRKQLHT